MPTSALSTPIDNLKRYYDNLNGISKLFFPRQLKIALQAVPRSNIDTIQAAFSSTWFFHRWFFPVALTSFFTSPGIRSAQALFDANALPGGKKRVQENIATLKELHDGNEIHPIDPDDVAAVLCALNNPNSLNNPQAQRNLKVLRDHRTPKGVARAIVLMDQLDAFTTDAFSTDTYKLELQLTHDETKKDIKIKKGVVYLETIAGGVLQYTVKINSETDPIIGQISAEELTKMGIRALDMPLTQKNVKELLLPKQADILKITSQRGHTPIKQSPQISYNTVVTGLESAAADNILSLLKDVGLLAKKEAPDNLLALLRLGKKNGKAESILFLLHDIGLLNPTHGQLNFSAVMAHPNRSRLLDALNRLNTEGLLKPPENAQIIFDDLISKVNPIAGANQRIAEHRTASRRPPESTPPVSASENTPVNPPVSIPTNASATPTALPQENSVVNAIRNFWAILSIPEDAPSVTVSPDVMIDVAPEAIPPVLEKQTTRAEHPQEAPDLVAPVVETHVLEDNTEHNSFVAILSLITSPQQIKTAAWSLYNQYLDQYSDQCLNQYLDQYVDQTETLVANPLEEEAVVPPLPQPEPEPVAPSLGESTHTLFVTARPEQADQEAIAVEAAGQEAAQEADKKTTDGPAV